jgi:hypothetical protein
MLSFPQQIIFENNKHSMNNKIIYIQNKGFETTFFLEKVCFIHLRALILDFF